jgi:hypothetical protein
MSSIKQLMPPHLKPEDNLYKTLVSLASQPNVRTLLDIGASSGEGTTAALVEGCSYKLSYQIFAMEFGKERFEKLKENYKDYKMVHPINGSSIKLKEFPSEENIREFHAKNKTVLNDFPVETILDWRMVDLNYIKDNTVEEDMIRKIKKQNKIENFDLVIIDGSEFTGEKELEIVWGSSIICLDDVNGYKNFNSYHRLKASEDYEILMDNLNERHGYAIFYKR